MLRVSEQTMRVFLAGVRVRYGSVDAYLAALGVDVSALRTALLVAA